MFVYQVFMFGNYLRLQRIQEWAKRRREWKRAVVIYKQLRVDLLFYRLILTILSRPRKINGFTIALHGCDGPNDISSPTGSHHLIVFMSSVNNI